LQGMNFFMPVLFSLEAGSQRIAVVFECY